MQNLAVRSRPKTLDDIKGQKPVVAVLKKLLEQGVPAMPMLFDGPRGTGKTSTARVIAHMLLPEEDLESSIHYIEIDAASHGLVEDVRRLRDNLKYSADLPRVIVIDEAQAMSREAFNAMLKVLEEPPTPTVFIFITTEPNKIPKTIHSRTLQFTFKKLTVEEIGLHLATVCGKPSQQSLEVLKYIAYRSQGIMRDALMMLDEATQAGITTVEQLEELWGEVDFAPSMIKAIIRGDIVNSFKAMELILASNDNSGWIVDQLVSTLKDVLILHSDGSIDSPLKPRQELKELLPAIKVVAALKVLWDYKTKTRATDDKKILLELAVIMLHGVLNV